MEYDQVFLNKGISYDSYLQELEMQISHAAEEDPQQKLLPYIQKNLEIMRQLKEQVEISEAFKNAIEQAPKTEWLVITEGWCGDAAFILPVLAVAESLLPQKVNLRLYYRDQNTEFMDAHFTNGSRSIPKLIILDKDLEFLESWGPRPQKLQQKMELWKDEGKELKELIPLMRDWYQKDHSKALQEELTQLFKEIKSLQIR